MLTFEQSREATFAGRKLTGGDIKVIRDICPPEALMCIPSNQPVPCLTPRHPAILYPPSVRAAACPSVTHHCSHRPSQQAFTRQEKVNMVSQNEALLQELYVRALGGQTQLSGHSMSPHPL